MHIIKVKFLKGDAPAGKPYTYYSPVAVAVGDKVQITETAVGVVVEADIQPWQVQQEAYRGKLKIIIGPVESPPETYDPLAATEAQSRYCREHGVPHVAPKSGRCWNCNQNIYLPGKYVVDGESKLHTRRDSPGISVERAGREHITGCPHCNWSFCE